MKNLEENISRYGGKGAHLLKLQEWGFAVPDFVVLPVESTDDETLAAFLQQHPSDSFAVRSSATVEDAAQQSFAGQFQTFLNVPVEEVLQKVEAVRASVSEAHLQRYAGEIKVFKMAVVVQRMISPEVSGVVFGADPVSGDRSKSVVSATYGLGEGLVSGEQDADTFTFHKGEWQEKLAHKAQQKVFAQSGIKTIAVEEKLRDQAALNLKQLHELKNLSGNLTRKFGRPQDIEFAVEDGKIWLLQSRAITALPSGKQMIFDNSNIIESYPGLTRPLTFSFIFRMYKAVYEQLTEILGVPSQTIVKNEEVFARMLALLNGRVYYNLINWYRVLAMVPGFKLNARYMEKMMGTGATYELPEEEHGNRWKTRWQFALSVIKILKALNGLKKETPDFQNYFNQVMEEYGEMDFEQMPAWEIAEKIKAFENVLLKKWRPPLVNDFFAMIFFGLFEKSLGKWYKGGRQALHNDLLIGSHDIVSARPVQLLAEIDSVIRKDARLLEFFKKDAEVIWYELEKAEEARPLILQFLEEFGERNVGELKLETITYRQKPELLLQRIKENLERDEPLRPAGDKGARLRVEAEKELKVHVKGGFKKWMLRYLLQKTRYLVSNRENLRYERTRAFGMVRRMFVHLGESLKKQGALAEARDIFYLKEEEVFEWLDGASVTASLKDLVSLRQREYEEFEKMGPLEERIEIYGLVYPDLGRHQEVVSSEGGLSGLACCAGVVEAPVRVIHSPEEAASLNGEILVTASTDPGWITLFYGAAGILVERGSLLSHSAIVSREMGLPCIVSIKGLLQSLKTGDRVRMNGATGTVEILQKNEQHSAV